MKRLQITFRTLSDGRSLTAKGRDAWALLELLKAGPRGCTPIDNPAPRWSAYVFNLKRQFELNIATVHEPHRGAFPGTHGRYILRDEIEIIAAPEARAA
jgi:hypothetical protein